MASVIVGHPDSGFSGYLRAAGRGLFFTEGFTEPVDLTAAQQTTLTSTGFTVDGQPDPPVPDPFPQYLTEDKAATAVGGAGPLPEALRAASVALLDERLPAPVDKFAAHGDSLTASTGTDWPTAVGTDLGIQAINRGLSGTASSDNATLQGGLTPLLTVTGNQIPASGAVTVTAVSPTSSFRTDGTGSFFWTGTLAGIPGTLTHNMTAATWSFTRTSAGSATACPAETPFYDTSGDTYRTWIQSLWVGRNNFTAGCDPNDVIRDTDLAVRHLLADRYLVLGLTTTGSETAGTANALTITKINGWLASRHGTKFVDIRRELIDNAMHVMGKTYTTQDRTDVANDVIPSTLKSDTIHLTADGYTFVGKVVAQRIRTLGYVPGKLPVVAPAAPTGLAAGTATTTTIPLTWTAVSGASAYGLEYRQTSTSTWSPAAGSTTAAATATGLVPGASYDFRVIAYNVAGASAASATVTASAASTPPVVLTSDSFNRADTAAGSLGTTDAALGGTAKAWTTDAQLQILGNRVGATTLTNPRFARVDLASSDHRVQAAFPVFGDNCGLVVRWTDSNNYYYLTITASTGQGTANKRVAGVGTIIGNPGLFAAGDTIGMSVVGSTVAIYRNGALVWSVTDTSLTTGTSAGLRSATSDTAFRIDDFIAYDH